jgi:hypothetical protein
MRCAARLRDQIRSQTRVIRTAKSKARSEMILDAIAAPISKHVPAANAQKT